MASKRHNERCKLCKEVVRNFLETLYGEVHTNYDLNMPSNLNDFRHHKLYDRLSKIHELLQNYRGHHKFVFSHKLSRVDYFLPNNGMIVEFDESQHFSAPRKLTFDQYPDILNLGFSIQQWTELCSSINAKDNDPPYRDEQRAWYDTLRDFAPLLLERGKTIRLYSREISWCLLKPERAHDLQLFTKIISNGE